MKDKTLKEHIKKIGDLKAKINELTTLFDTEKKTITAELKERDTTDFTASGYTVKYKEYQTNRIDSAALKKAGLYEMYSRTVNTSRFEVI